MAEPISIENITKNVTVSNNVVIGDGAFDDLMETVNLHIKAQFDSGRLKGSDYATVYLGAIQSVIAQSMQFELQRASTEAQTALYERQKEGFDDNKYQKLFETQMNSWGLMFSSGLLTQVPTVISSDKASELYTELTSDITAP